MVPETSTSLCFPYAHYQELFTTSRHQEEQVSAQSSQLHYLYDSGDLPISAFYLQPRVITQKTSFSGCDSEFQVSQGYCETLCQTNKQNKTTKQMAFMHYTNTHPSAECFLYNKSLCHFHVLPMLSFTIRIQKHFQEQFKYLKLVT